MYLLIDESGTLPDLQDSHIVLAAIAVPDTNDLDRIFRGSSHEKISRKRSEFKFYHMGPKSKKRFFMQFRTAKVDIFLLIIDKKGRKIADTPDNMAILSTILLDSVLASYPAIHEISFDKHFSRSIDLKRFDTQVQTYLNRPLSISHKDSQSYQIINIADMVAGATLAKTRGNDTYYNMMKAKVHSEIHVSWPEAKARFIFSPKKIA